MIQPRSKDNEAFAEKTKLVERYLRKSGCYSFDGNVNSDHLKGFDNPTAYIPHDLSVKRHIDFSNGQIARKLRNADHYTHISARKEDGELFAKVYSGRLSRKSIISICKKNEALVSIEARTLDNATGKYVDRKINFGLKG